MEFFFDYSSPFAYLGSTQVERVARAHRAEVLFRPILLGGLFRAIGTPLVPLQAMSEAKRAHQLEDIQRWAETWDVPLRFPSRFPLRTVDALRLTLLVPEPARPALIHRLMRAFWAEDLDPTDPDVLRACAREVSLTPALVDRTAEMRDALREATDEAVRRGVPGVPTFIVDDLLFWGQDRIPFVERALDGWRPKPWRAPL